MVSPPKENEEREEGRPCDFFFFLNEYLIYTVDGYPAVR